ncbi:MAG: glutaredoxin family protein [Desulfocapsaceae bacterium]|nr:glutaredoxin family protein [Desulfocapsaceae bacterium]
MPKLRVKLLVLTTCLQCKALKDLLTEYGVDFDSVDVDLMFKEERDELFAKMAPYNEKKAFPVTFIGNKAIVGFQKDVIMEELGLKYEC